MKLTVATVVIPIADLMPVQGGPGIIIQSQDEKHATARVIMRHGDDVFRYWPSCQICDLENFDADPREVMLAEYEKIKGAQNV